MILFIHQRRRTWWPSSRPTSKTKLDTAGSPRVIDWSIDWLTESKAQASGCCELMGHYFDITLGWSAFLRYMRTVYNIFALAVAWTKMNEIDEIVLVKVLYSADVVVSFCRWYEPVHACHYSASNQSVVLVWRWQRAWQQQWLYCITYCNRTKSTMHTFEDPGTAFLSALLVPNRCTDLR